MNKTRYWLLAIALLWSLGGMLSQAQTAQPPQEKSGSVITRAVEVKYGDPTRIKLTLEAIAKVNYTVVTGDARNKILLITGSPERVAEMEALIHRLDLAPPQEKTIEVTIYLLAAGDIGGAATNVPPQLGPAMKQLLSTFMYKWYQVLDTIFMRNRTGEGGGISGYLPSSEPDVKDAAPGRPPYSQQYHLEYAQSYLTQDDHGMVIHIDRMVLRLPRGDISTNLDIRPGQTAVIGKTNSEGGNNALIAIVTAKIID